MTDLIRCVAVGSECSMNRVCDGDRSTLLSFVSCGALQSDEIIGILKVLFPVYGDRHAVGDVQRHLDGGAGVGDPGARPDRFCAVAGRACQHTSSRSLFAGRWPVSALPPAKRRARLNTCQSRPVSARCTRYRVQH